MSCEVVATRGGAPAIRDLATGEVMHPVVGPAREAEASYLGPSRLEARLRGPGEEPLVLLDVGLGAGSLAVAAWHLSERLPPSCRPLHIVSFDRSVAALELALAHPAAFALDGPAGAAARAVLRGETHQTARTCWRLRRGELPATLGEEPEAGADVIFWDAFSPRRNPELWSVAAFAQARRHARAGCTLHTYSGATATRAALILAGFEVGVGVLGGAGKPGTIAAVPPATLAAPLDARWLARLHRSSAPLPADAPPDALAWIAGAPQLQHR